MDIPVGFLQSHQVLAPERWYVVQHKPNAEAVAIRNLKRQLIEVFAPFEMATKRYGSKLRPVRKPLFPGYVFVHFDVDEFRWRAVNSTFGVSRLVQFGTDKPAPVPGELMHNLIARCDFSGCLLPPSELQPGDEVRIKTGPFADFVGTVEKMGPQQRVWLLLEFLGRATRVAVETADVKRLTA